MKEGEKSSFIIPYQKLYGEQGIPGNLPQRSDLSFTINLQSLTAEHTQRESAHLVATLAEKEREEEEQTQKDNQCTHLTIYTRIAVEFIIKQSEPRFTEVPTATNPEEKSSKREDSEEESHTEEANQDRKSDQTKQEASAEKAGGKRAHTTTKNQNSNIKQVFKTVITALWPEFSTSHFLFHSSPYNQNP